MANDKILARRLLNEQGFDVDEDRIHIPSKRCDMDLKRKTQLRNLLTAYRNDVCEEARELAEIRLTDKCTQCDYYDCDRGCTIDNILLTLENELWRCDNE